MKLIDDFLNSITMYRLMLYFLLVLLLWAIILSFFGKLPFATPVTLIGSIVFITFVCWTFNATLGRLFKAPTNAESFYITAWIICLIVTPGLDLQSLIFMFAASVLAISSKFILSINKKHIFNPAAFGAYTAGLLLPSTLGVSWWVGTELMFPVTLIGGLLITRKTKRWSLLFTFLVFSLSVFLIRSGSINETIFLNTPMLFFAFVMLTEPQTSPVNNFYRIIYGSAIGFLYPSQFQIGALSTSPEMILLLGNIFAYLVNPKQKLILHLKQKNKLSPDTFDFVFGLDKPLAYTAGQFMEWTLAQKKPDTRGSRRYFTLASSPTEDSLRIGVKFYPNGSSFKKALSELPIGGSIVAASLAGSFTIPKDPDKKLVFIAGGIGVTPFRSMIKYLVDQREKRDIVLLYFVKADVDAVYTELFKQAEKEIGLKNIINISERNGQVGAETIVRQIPDFKERIFYLSGPHGMVDGFEKTLKGLGLSGSQIKTDYFPGYA